MDHETPPEFDKRGFLNCAAWTGAGALYTFAGGVAASSGLDQAHNRPAGTNGLSFLQISDTHIGFNKAANPDPISTLRETVAKIRALPRQPDFILHTGDITHLATPAQFDTAQQIMSETGITTYFVPGEHDIIDGTNPAAYLARFGAGTAGEGWRSFDIGGVHFIGLVNSIHLSDQGMGSLGVEQLAWLRADIAHLRSSTPIVVYAHFPMWALFPDWGWGTEDSVIAMRMLRRFGSVTVLNGHIHQIQQRVEGNTAFHTARSTAFPQPTPGNGPGPGPLVLPAEQLRQAIGLTSVTVKKGRNPIALIDTKLADMV
jgi:3',5'-cyclic-AMP phosphodiesterase